MRRLSLSLSIRNHQAIFKRHGGLFARLPVFLFGERYLEDLVERQVVEALKRELPPILQHALEKRGVRCQVEVRDAEDD